MLTLNSKRSLSPIYRRPLISPKLWLVPLVVVFAVIVGATIANGWLYCLGFCLLCLLLLWPVEVGLGTYVLFLPFDQISAIGSQNTGTSIEWVLGILAGVAVLGTTIVRGRFRRPPKVVLWWVVLVFWATISSTWAMDPDLVFRHLPTVLSLLALFLICASTRFEERELKAIALLCIAGGCAAAVYTALLFPPSQAVGDALTRNSMTWGNRAADPNDFAQTLLLPLALSLGGFLFLRKRRERMFMLAAFALITYAVLLTLSRGALLALLLMTAIYIRYIPRGLRGRIMIPATIFGLAVLAMSAVLLRRLTLGFETGGSGRLDIWMAGLHAIKEHGFIGAGLDNFPLAYSEVAGFAAQFQGLARASHNIFLNIWVELGLPGLLLFLFAMGSHLHNAKRVLRARVDQFSAPILFCYAACWATITGGLFLDIVWRKSFWLSWTFLMLAMAARQDHRQDIPHPYRQHYQEAA